MKLSMKINIALVALLITTTHLSHAQNETTQKKNISSPTKQNLINAAKCAGYGTAMLIFTLMFIAISPALYDDVYERCWENKKNNYDIFSHATTACAFIISTFVTYKKFRQCLKDNVLRRTPKKVLIHDKQGTICTFITHTF